MPKPNRGRPEPFGLAGVTIADPGPPLAAADLDAFEALLGFKLTDDYRAFLLLANGGIPTPNSVPSLASEAGEDRDDESYEDDEFDDDDDDGYGGEDEDAGPSFAPRLSRFFPLRDPGGLPEGVRHAANSSVEGMIGYYMDDCDIPEGMVAIGEVDGWGVDGTGFVLLACTGADKDRLFGMDYRIEPLGLTLRGLFEELASGIGREMTPDERLASAVKARDLDAVRAALADGASPFRGESRGESASLEASEAGFDDAVMAMADAGASPDRLLVHAAMAGCLPAIRRLVDRVDGPSKAGLDEAIVSGAGLYADVTLIDRIVARGGDLRATLHGQVVAPFLAARGGSVDGLRRVLSEGFDPSIVDDQGLTLLHHAAFGDGPGAGDVIRHLIGAGARPNRPDRHGQTALHKAVQAGNLDAATALIDAGEDLDARHPIAGALTATQMERMLAQVQGFRASNAPDLPPPDPDSSLGETLSVLSSKVDSAISLYRERLASGDHGKGASAAEMARGRPDRAPILDALRAHAASRG